MGAATSPFIVLQTNQKGTKIIGKVECEGVQWWYHHPCSWSDALVGLDLWRNHDKMGRNQQQQNMATMPAVFWGGNNCKGYIEAKGSTKESINKIMTANWNLYLKVMEAKATQDKKEQEEHIQEVAQQNATLITVVQEQQKKIEELMTTHKNLLNKMTWTPQNPDSNGTKSKGKPTREGNKMKMCSNCKSWVCHNSDKCYMLQKPSTMVQQTH